MSEPTRAQSSQDTAAAKAGARLGPPGHVSAPFETNDPRTARRRALDKCAAYFVTCGGIVIIFSILAILLVIVDQTYPLFLAPKLAPMHRQSLGVNGVLAVGCDEYQSLGYLVHEEGIAIFDLETGAMHPAQPSLPLAGAKVVAASAEMHGNLLLGLSDNRVMLVCPKFRPTFPNGADGPRVMAPEFESGDPVALKAAKEGALRSIGLIVVDERVTAVVGLEGGALALLHEKERTGGGGMLGMDEGDSGPKKLEALELPVNLKSTANCIALAEAADYAYLGKADGELVALDIRAPDKARIASQAALATNPKPIVSLRILLGGGTILAGDAEGQVQTFHNIRQPDNTRELTRINAFAPHAGPAAVSARSQRNKSFLTGSPDGEIHVSYATTGDTQMRFKAPFGELAALAITPKGDGILAASRAGEVQTWHLDNPHPETTLHSLFGKVWYEGYDKPEHVWQSTGGTDDFESKLGMMPLVVGTIKGTFYALLFAVPLGLLSALYVSQFMHPSLRVWVKPSVEIMAAMPSVVLGFLAGLWLAPRVEAVAPGVFLAILVMPSTILLALLAWEYFPEKIRHKLPHGHEVYLLIPLVVAGLWISLALGDAANFTLFGGDYRSWLTQSLGVKYDQRNSLVVGLAMGVAVIPIIFTIAEDSLSNVPQHLKAGSLALGSTSWQAAFRVIVPTASPGIFSAVMIGFGRAVGETMIVLMATGNTPVMDLSMFTGFRALSANIAVELPEAAKDSTHYRALFLGALLLFGMTFFVNTIAEVVRLRLRRKYRVL
ncbi:MAG: ABC transporter permease subunit [Planctomycetota bacterium]|nr:ABC transporter permease subunit [Planctomycetota bacterium]